MAAGRPKGEFVIGNRIIVSTNRNRPSQAKLLLGSWDGNRYGCNGAQGLTVQRRINKQFLKFQM